MNRIIIILLVLLVSCGKKQADQLTTTTNVVTNEIFQEYIEEFDDLGYQERGNDYSNAVVPINFGSTFHNGKNRAGLCHKYTDGTREIIINKEWWDRKDDIDRKTVVFHELGHCHLNKSHGKGWSNFMRTPTFSNKVWNPGSITQLFSISE